MDEETPEWFDTDFLSVCLQNESKNKNVIVTDFLAEPAVPPGNNYGSVVIRVKLRYKDKTSTNTNDSSKTLVVKLPLTKGAMKEAFSDSLDKEYTFYGDYIPKAYKILKKCNFVPKFYPSPKTMPVVVLEDLKESGFIMADRKEMLAYENCKRYAKSAAAFHAGSFAVCKHHPELVKTLGSEIMFSDELKLAVPNKNMIRYGLDCMADCILKTTGDKRISNIVKRCSTDLWSILIEAVKPDDTFNTLNQGDPWLTNMMFRYDDEGSCVDVKLLDFQALRYCSPASDLVFFIWSSAKNYVREEKLEDFYQTYVEAINGYLEEANCSERLSLEVLKKLVQKMSPLALWIVGLALPLTKKTQVADVDGIWTRCEKEYSPENNPYNKYYTEDYCTNEMAPLVKQLETQKVFDYLEKYFENL